MGLRVQMELTLLRLINRPNRLMVLMLLRLRQVTELFQLQDTIRDLVTLIGYKLAGLLQQVLMAAMVAMEQLVLQVKLAVTVLPAPLVLSVRKEIQARLAVRAVQAPTVATVVTLSAQALMLIILPKAAFP